jgi:hypothetical protein
MADNPNFNSDAWNAIDSVEEHLKELMGLMQTMYRFTEYDEDKTNISALITFTQMIETEVEAISDMVGPKAQKAA